MTKAELIDRYSYLKTAGNSLEFKQRLQWLSEGMLRNHMEHVIVYKPNEQEMADYKAYKEMK